MKKTDEKVAQIRAEVTSRLQSQIHELKKLSPTSKRIEVILTKPVREALETIANQSGESVSEVAANVLSGWVAEVSQDFDAVSQQTLSGQ
jgi:predicted transcriptional regulator